MQTHMEMILIAAIFVLLFKIKIQFYKEPTQIISKDRDPRWKSLRNRFIFENPCCAVCGKCDNLIVHHKLPVSLFPHKQLDWSNLVTLCENNNFNCHFVVGHLMDWRNYNPDIDRDIKYWNQKLFNTHEKSSSNFLWW